MVLSIEQRHGGLGGLGALAGDERFGQRWREVRKRWSLRQVLSKDSCRRPRLPSLMKFVSPSAPSRWPLVPDSGGFHGTPPDHDEVRATLIRIRRDVHRASEVFDALRALFGKSGQEREPIDVNRIVRDVTNSLREELDSHGVMAHYELTELPLVNGHGAQLREAVFNLIDNARRSHVQDDHRKSHITCENRGSWSR